MVFVMKHNIKLPLYILSVTFLFAFLLTMNSPLMSQPQGLVYATSQQEQEADQQEDLHTTSDARESETNTGSINSEQTEGNGEDENNDEDLIESEVGCSAVATTDPNYVHCNTQQQPIQPQQQQIPQHPSQQNTSSSPSQNTLAGPTINSDGPTTSTIPNTETTMQSFNPARQFNPGSGLTGLNIPKSFFDPAIPYNPGAGNNGPKGSSIIPNTNPVTPIEPGNIPSKIEDRLAYLTVYSNSTSTKPVEICVFISQPHEVRGNPYCIEASPEGTFHAVQAPGLIGIRASGNVDKVDTSNCEFRIYPKESKSCVLNIIDSPFLKSKSETSGQDRLRTPIG